MDTAQGTRAMAAPAAAGLPISWALTAALAQRFDYVVLGMFARFFDRGKAAGFGVAANLASNGFFACHGVHPC